MVACRSNARELLEEADALLPRRNFARAYALLHTACEEFAKFSVLELGGRRLARGDEPPWKRFWQRFRSHDSKIAQLNLQLLYLLAETEEDQLRKIVESMETLLNYGITIRNSALYVDIGPDGKFRMPSDIDFDTPLPILRAATKLALDAADRRGLSTDEIELGLRKPQDESTQRNILKVFAKVVQRAKDVGVEKEKLVEMIEKARGGKRPKRGEV